MENIPTLGLTILENIKFKSIRKAKYFKSINKKFTKYDQSNT